jgi:hypothetical protein
METSRHDAAAERTRAALTMMPETFVRNWQMTGGRMLRAQERMLHGMMSVTRLEMQFGQDLIMNRMARFNTRNDNGTRADGVFEEFDRMITMMREVSEELRAGFSEATQLLTEEAAPERVQAGARLAKKMTETAEDTASTAATANESTINAEKDTAQKSA